MDRLPAAVPINGSIAIYMDYYQILNIVNIVLRFAPVCLPQVATRPSMAPPYRKLFPPQAGFGMKAVTLLSWQFAHALAQ